MSTTTTTTKSPDKDRKLNVFEYLDTVKLTRAERSYYEKHYKQDNQDRTIDQWSKIIKFIHS